MLPVVASLLPPFVPGGGGAGAQLPLIDDLHAGAAVAAARPAAAAATAGEGRAVTWEVLYCNLTCTVASPVL